MSSLTIEKMDKINFLITEVSLECLGNKYFDIYGNQSDSLLRLISASSLKPGAIDEDRESDLWTSLTATEVTKTSKTKSVNRRQAASAAAAAAAAEAAANVNKKPMKRRASFSIANETDAANDPESLLVPMAPKAAKISNRRSTISVQLAKSRNRTIPIAINSIPMHTKTRRSITAPEAVQQCSKSVAEIKQDLSRNTNARFNTMRLLSETQEEKYRTLNINPTMEDFYKAERKNLFTQCNTLLRFIKFIQEDRDNALKLTNVTQAISEVQNEY